MAGQLYLLEQMGNGNDTLDNLKWYNLFGDPSMVMRTDTAKEFQVRHHLEIEEEPSLKVEVTDMNGAPVSGLTVSLTDQTRFGMISGKTGADGIANLPMSGIGSLGNATLTVTGYNYMTYETTLQ